MKNRIRISSILTGLLIITAGVLLLLFNSGVLDVQYKYIVFSWQSLLIAMGFIFLFSRYKWFMGVLLMLVGGFFLLRKMNIESMSFITDNLWTVVLILVGIFVLGKAIWGPRYFRYHAEARRMRFQQQFGECCSTSSCESGKFRDHSQQPWENRRSNTGYIDRNYIFSGSKEKINTKDFKGGEINCIFGGMELDLMDAQLAEGVNTLNVSTVFGGLVIYAPAEWKIEIHRSNVMGNFVDNRPKPTFEVDDKRLLIIEISSVLGGGEIKSR